MLSGIIFLIPDSLAECRCSRALRAGSILFDARNFVRYSILDTYVVLMNLNKFTIKTC